MPGKLLRSRVPSCLASSFITPALVFLTPPSVQAQPSTWVPLDESPPGTPAEVVFVSDGSGAGDSFIEVILHGFWKETRIGPDSVTYEKIDVPGLGNLGVVGAPHLPAVRALLAVPTDAAAVSLVEVIPLASPQSFSLHLWPEPIGAQVGETFTPEVFTLDSLVYTSPGPYPAVQGSASALISMFGSVPTSSPEVYPCRWTPATDVLEVLPASRWHFAHEGTAAVADSITKDRVRLCSQLMMNWGVVDQYFPGNIATYQGEYLFVYPSVYLPSIKALIGQKKMRGYTVAQIVTDTLAVVDCTHIRSAIQNWYLATPSSSDHYCLLAGDNDRIPLCNEGTMVKPVWTDDSYGVFNSGFPAWSVFIGRLAARDAADLTHQVAKIINYEDHPVNAPVYYRDIFLVAHKEGGFQSLQDSVRTAMYAVQPTFFTCYGTNPSHDNARVTNFVNAGEGITCYRGHGGSSNWQQWNLTNQSYTFSNVDALSNGALTTVVWAIACNNAYLFDSGCMGKHWMSRFPGGAVAHYAATLASWNQPNDDLELRLFDAVWNKGMTNQAHATTWAEMKMILGDGQAGGYNALLYILLGDPDMQIRREGPKIWEIVQPLQFPVVPEGSNAPLDIKVMDELGTPVAEALVALWKPTGGGGSLGVGSFAIQSADDEVADNAYTAADGWAHFQVSPRTPGLLYFTVRDSAGNSLVDSIAVGQTTGVPGPGPAPFAFRAVPGVSRGSVTFRFGRPLDAPGEVRVFDAAGRQVAALRAPAGAETLTWPVRSASRERLASGVYFAAFRSLGIRATARVVILG